MKPTPHRIVPLLICLVIAADARSECRVWTVTETVRVLRDAPAGDGASVRLRAARNEAESFQVLLRSDAVVDGVRVAPGDLVGPEGAVLPASATARLYRQHQFQLDVGTHRNDDFHPGWYPDALIPVLHPLTGKPLSGARFTAMPFDLPANETHGFWIDIHVPPDAVAGEYRGTYRVTSAAGLLVEIPVALEVWDFELPRVSTMTTALGSPAGRMRGYYSRRAAAGKEEQPLDWDAVQTQCAELLTRHRINATPPPGMLVPEAAADGTFDIPDERTDALRTFVDRYHVNALQTPHPRTAVTDPEAQREKLAAWLESWNRTAAKLDRPGVVFFTYLKDEPNDPQAYAYVQRWGRAVHSVDTALKVMVVEQTSTQNEAWGNLYGAIDIWCPLFPLFDAESATKRQALGETIWTYTALCQRDKTPWWHTDFPLLHYRVPSWIAWRYRIRGLLYWGGMSYWNDVDDPWTEPGTLDRRDSNPALLYNGEGSLVYPGRAVGYDGIAPSLRLKALRDSIEDYEYLAILERLGLAAEAQQIVHPLAGSWFEWNSDPTALEKARAQLGEICTSGSMRGR